MGSKNKIGYAIGGAVLGVLILLGILFAFTGKSLFKSQSVVLSRVQPFSFINQDGLAFTDEDIQGKVCIVSYFSTQCQSTCPLMNASLHKIYNEFKQDSGFMILSHTWNPKVDSVSALKHYADSLHVNEHQWVFLTGPKDSLYYAARNSYLLDDADVEDVDNIEKEFLHTEFVVLVDRNGQVRGQLYDALRKKDLKKLRSDIKTLLKEREEGADEFVNNVM